MKKNKSEELIEFFESFLTLGRVYKGGREHYFVCPDCKRRKLAINFERGAGHCWVCGRGFVNLRSIVSKFAPDQLSLYDSSFGGGEDIFDGGYESIDVKIPEPMKLPESFGLLGQGGLDGRAREYLNKRGVSNDVIETRHIGLCTSGKYRGYIIFPSFGSCGFIDFFLARTFNGQTSSKLKYLFESVEKKNIIWDELFVDWNAEVIILVEGIFDYLSVANKDTHNVIPLTGSILDVSHRLFYRLIQNNNKVIVALDDDAKNKEDNIVRLLKKYGINVEGYNIGQYGFHDPSEMGAKFWEHISGDFVCRTGLDELRQKILMV